MKRDIMNKYTILINKQNKIKTSYLKNYKLVSIKNYEQEECLLEEETFKAYLKLKKYLEKQNIEIALDSGYRSLEYQQELYEKFKQELKQEDVSYRVALPGTSEHHTGLALDIILKINGKYLEDDKDIKKHLNIFQEIEASLSKFGFILRYPKDKENIILNNKTLCYVLHQRQSPFFHPCYTQKDNLYSLFMPYYRSRYSIFGVCGRSISSFPI